MNVVPLEQNESDIRACVRTNWIYLRIKIWTEIENMD
jgi:hypothetical protein